MHISAETGRGIIIIYISFFLQNSYLWRIHTSPPIFLFGTMHVPYTQLWQHIPENVKTAFSSSEELCLELQLLDSDTVSELSRCRLLPEGQALESVLSGEIIARVASYLERIKELLPIWTQQQTGNVNPLFGGVLSRYVWCELLGGVRELWGKNCDIKVYKSLHNPCNADRINFHVWKLILEYKNHSF